jgi:hypothetical protein
MSVTSYHYKKKLLCDLRNRVISLDFLIDHEVTKIKCLIAGSMELGPAAG